MVSQNGFSVDIIATTSDITGDYVTLPNNTEYSIQLCNNRDTGCDVYVKIDGQKIGGWKISPNSCITIERPGDDAHRFTFFRETSPEAIGANINIGSFNNGLVEATFYPQRRLYRYNEPVPTLLPQMRASQSLGAQSGVTLMGRESYQQFTLGQPLHPDEIDWSNVTTIYVRLIAQREQPQYYRYRPRSNPIPPRIDDPFIFPPPPYFPSPNFPNLR